MSEYIARIRKASSWQEYYDAYKDAYRYLIEERWAFGDAGFAHQLHHTAIPDITGTTVGALNWAVYSQPSSQSLAAFLPVFRDMLRSEPHRIHSSRYLFFVTDGSPLVRDDVIAVLGELGGMVDFWCGSLEKSILVVERYALPLGLDSLLGSGTLLEDFPLSSQQYQEDSAWDFLQSMHEFSKRQLPIETSVAPLLIRKPLVDSFFILMAFRMHIEPQQLISVIGEHSGLAAYIAANRAKASSWGVDTIDYCKSILTLCPPKVVEYVVQAGDILSRIVRTHFEMSFAHLWPLIRVLNPEISDPNRIVVGQRIRLPDLSVGQGKNDRTI